MAAEIWGTFSVSDHVRTNAFVREVLLFDRLIIPVPGSDEERARWVRPKVGSDETWAPDRQQKLLSILGTQDQPGHNGAHVAYTAPWNDFTHAYEKSRLEVTNTINAIDAFSTTRFVLASGVTLPASIEAVSAFPSARECRDELKPSANPHAVDGARALLLLSRPFLVPDGDEDADFTALRAAIDLSLDDNFRAARSAYHDWLRALLTPLNAEGARLDMLTMTEAWFRHLQQELEELVEKERAAIEPHAKRWLTRTEYAATAAGAVAGIAGTAMGNTPISIASVVLGFGGFIAGKVAAADPDRKQSPLSGASMFVAAEQHFGWSDGLLRL